jgi:hypothetical protein
MANEHIGVILGCGAVALILVIILVYIAFWRANGKKEMHSHAVVGLEGVMPTETKRRNSHGSAMPPEKVERAHKFRERARATTIGRPEFKVSDKYKGKNIYKTLQNHPDFAAWEAKHIRRVSEDRTSNCNSVSDDMEAPNPQPASYNSSILKIHEDENNSDYNLSQNDIQKEDSKLEIV